MSKYRSAIGLAATLLLAATSPSFAGDAEAGAKVFKKCAACHAVGEGAKNKAGPELNDLIGRTAGTESSYKYSKAMAAAGADGLVWGEDTLGQFLTKPRNFVNGTKMTFAGLKSEDDIANIVTYLETFSSATAALEPAAPVAEPEAVPATKAEVANPTVAMTFVEGAGAHFGLGRVATEDEISAWDIDVRPDGLGLPEGQGSVADGGVIYDENCAACHGDFGEGIGRWPVLAGGIGTLTDERPVKTVGSYWPYLSTVFDYIRRAMPFGNARSLSDDEYYALTAYILYLNDVVDDEDFVLSKDNFLTIRLPNEGNFIADDRAEEAHYKSGEICMTDCKPGKAEITMHAAVLDVTPDVDSDEGGGAID